MPTPLKINAAIYDDNDACFSFYPAKGISRIHLDCNQSSEFAMWVLSIISKICGVEAKKLELRGDSKKTASPVND